jgi:DNA-binding GntR family transcriptional regulator
VKSVAEVRQILHAIEQRDPEKAAAACREHVQNVAKAALSGLAHQQNEEYNFPITKSGNRMQL